MLEDDLDLLVELGVTAYRFSTAWARVLPLGIGEKNEAGLAFYDRLVDGLLARGIEPWLTLYHWDLPQALQDKGGWSSRESVDWFAEYTELMIGHFGDRVSKWITVNEPWVSSFLGHLDGIFAPGLTDWPTALRAGHHQLLAHGEAVRTIRRHQPDASVGIALDCRHATPATDSPEDIAATKHFDGFRNRWFFDPVFGIGYPQDIVEVYERLGRLPSDMIQPGDMDVIAEPTDFLGINFYTSLAVSAGSEEVDESEGSVGAPAQTGFTEMGWNSDGVSADGRVHDARRTDYLSRHIDQIDRIRSEGVDVDGYFVWSFLDNLEWMSGFDQRFGIVHVDHATQSRTIKESGYWYRDYILTAKSGD
jgi:beta-glucosidase